MPTPEVIAPRFSIIIPVYNRPDEMRELMASLKQQTFNDFEVVVVEDGSTLTSEEVVEESRDVLNIKYIVTEKVGPSNARNRGIREAEGAYYIFTDSDCILPEDYLAQIDQSLRQDPVEVFGGPDRAAPGFNRRQKSISYAMTSFLTTGGIRGGKKQVDRYYPRSFNMGISRKAMQLVGGFPVTRMHPGEDMVFTIELMRQGVTTRCIYDAYVFHKRRTTYRNFFRQVFGFGKTRYLISGVYPDTFKFYYLFPAGAVISGAVLLIFGMLFDWLFLTPVVLFAWVLIIDASFRHRSLVTGLLSCWAAFIQITGYGLGYLDSWCRVTLLQRDEYGVLAHGFYPD
ncbi:MAG: glycosyltransferase [Bacteroidales bacterium]|nr:glycosyltransferase [Bacteroidales bacterium]